MSASKMYAMSTNIFSGVGVWILTWNFGAAICFGAAVGLGLESIRASVVDRR